MIFKIFLFNIVICSFIVCEDLQVFKLKNGTKIKGEIASENDVSYEINSRFGLVQINKKDIKKIECKIFLNDGNIMVGSKISSSKEHVILDNDLVVASNGFVVLGADNDPSLNGGITMDYVYNGFTLSNLWDEVILVHPSGVIIDSVYYDNGNTFPDESGKSMMLLNPVLDNSPGENWATADIVFGSGDYGTPGETNYPGDCTESLGDMDGNGSYNVLDVVILVNCVLVDNCSDLENGCSGDMDGNGSYNILDVVILVNCVLADNCRI